MVFYTRIKGFANEIKRVYNLYIICIRGIFGKMKDKRTLFIRIVALICAGLIFASVFATVVFMR